ncbi:amino acid/peptide transporter [Coriobacterium glomerans PW2]|uniref:Amino acid/peptide transporter n=1 Tax=Coriobacterium glomerans (strain ATCC 49209 / DSM 20642 / JCM 10262 / PW2) TaxID=700015 RepID=F2N9X1_CORGP|nr:oligopeptide:H+ symporter [Coriobacterium glomerans]AEB06226.1 amino acid/peptide transporter [Coriobacterium glomerans PW2]
MAEAVATPSHEADVSRALRRQTSFLGHPKAVGSLSFMVLCNSFANYGMSAILVYYLYAQIPTGLGLTQAEAAQLVSLYSACTVLTGLIGSYVADRVLGPRRALTIARSIQALAFTLLAIPFLGIFGYAASQVLLCIGTMAAGRSQDALTKKMYDLDDPRCDGAFGLQYVINNIGAAVPALVGTVALVSGYHVAFALPAALQIAGVVVYVLTQESYFGPIGLEPDDPMTPAAKRTFLIGLAAAVAAAIALGSWAFISGTVTISVFANAVSTVAIFVPLFYLAYIIKSKKNTREESRHVMSIVPLFLCTAVTNVVFQQAMGVLSIYSETTVDRMLFGIEVTPAIFSTLGAVFSIVFGSICTLLWTKLKRQPTAAAKVGFGSMIYGIAPLFMCLPFLLYPVGVKVSPLWIIGFWFIAMLGEAIGCPVGYSASAKVAPAAFSTQMITVWALTGSFGGGMATIMVNFYHEGSEVPYFMLLGGICIVISLAVLVFSRQLERGMGFASADE